MDLPGDRASHRWKEKLIRRDARREIHTNCKVDAPRTMRLQLETRNRLAGCAGSDEWASSKNLQPEIFVILKWNCLRARTPWHNSPLPFEIVRSIGVPSPNISCEVVNEVVEHLNESYVNETRLHVLRLNIAKRIGKKKFLILNRHFLIPR